jgi:DNA invertase Pin-like site-specific DNA recombinase
MSRESKFTPEVFDEIRSLVAQGRSRAEIASNVGCTVGTLRVRCSQQGISCDGGKLHSSMGSPATE